MTWLEIVTSFLGAFASGDKNTIKSLVSEDIKYNEDLLNLHGLDELLSIVSQTYKIQIKNWAYKNKLVFIEYISDMYPKVGVYEINNMGKICSIRIYG